MPLITGGRVAYARTKQPAPYESVKGESELFFTLEEGEDVDAALDEVGAIVKEHALALVKTKRSSDLADNR